MSPKEHEILKRALTSLESVNVDYYSSSRAKGEHYDYASLGRMMMAQRALAELLGESPNQYLFPGESAYDPEDNDDLSDWQRFASVSTGEKLTEQEKKFLQKTVLSMLSTLGGMNDSDDACLRCANRMIAEVSGHPHLNSFRLLMEKELKPLYFKEYEPLDLDTSSKTLTVK